MSKQAGQKKIEGDDEQSEWSLSSLQQLKGLDLNQLKQQQDNDHHQNINSLANQKSKLQVKYPPLHQIKSDTKLYEVGKIISKVAELLIVEANNCHNLVDLDNWLFAENKECIGFVIDIFGKVQHPFYAVKLLPNMEKQIATLQNIQGLIVYYADGCKTLTEDDIKSIKQKSSVKQAEPDNQDSNSQSDNEEDFRSNVIMRRRQRSPKRRGSVDEEPLYRRERTREKKNARKFQGEGINRNRKNYDSRNPNEINRDRQHNQAYLEGMYNMYYTQMMQLYNGQSGMAPKPPVFPMFQQPIQQQGTFHQPTQQQGMFPQPNQQQTMFSQPNQQQGMFTQPIQQHGLFSQANPFHQTPNFPMMMPQMPQMPQMSQFPQGSLNIQQGSVFPQPPQKPQ